MGVIGYTFQLCTIQGEGIFHGIIGHGASDPRAGDASYVCTGNLYAANPDVVIGEVGPDEPAVPCAGSHTITAREGRLCAHGLTVWRCAADGKQRTGSGEGQIISVPYNTVINRSFCHIADSYMVCAAVAPDGVFFAVIAAEGGNDIAAAVFYLRRYRAVLSLGNQQASLTQ